MSERIEKILNHMCLMDDTFMTVALDGNTEAISILVSTVLQRKVYHYQCHNTENSTEYTR